MSNLTPANLSQPSTLRPLAASVHRNTGPGLNVDDEFLLRLLPGYWTFLYTTCPLLDTEFIRASVVRRGSEASHAALCYSFAAVTLAITSSPLRKDNFNTVFKLITRALQIRPVTSSRSVIDLKNIISSVFLRIAFGILQDQDMELFYHREAVAMFQIVYLDQTRNTAVSDDDQAVWQRLHWVLFIYERLAAIATDQPANLAPPTDLPLSDCVIPRDIHLGFTRACDLYRQVDNEFLTLWHDKDGAPGLTEQWIIAKQERLEQQRIIVDETCPELNPIQRADLVLTCQWLRLLVWQMATRKYLLRSDALQDYMLLYFPVQGSAHLEKILQESDQKPLEHYGIGILRKMFEVVDVVSDILAVSATLHFLEDKAVVGQWLGTACGLIRHLQQSGKLNTVQRTIIQQKLDTLELIHSTFH